MKRRDFNLSLGAAAVTPVLLARAARAATAPAWSLNADIAECCSCEIPCPCNFGRPTELRCDGNRLIQITEGQIEGRSLAGISFVATFEMREWVKIYLDERLSDAQMKAFETILPVAFAGFHKLSRALERVPLTVTRAGSTVRFATPASEVEMEMLKGLDGQPIKISGLPSPVFYDYTQYESVKHVHRGGEREWSYSGTNGFTSRMIVAAS